MMRPLRILIAEDEAGDVALLKRALSQSSHKVPVHFVRNGREVIDFLERNSLLEDLGLHAVPSLLLLDLKMPRMDGFEVLQWLRDHPAFRQILVVVLTSSEQNEDMQRAYDLGADSYVVKPQDPAEFMDLIQEMEKYWLRLHATPECGELAADAAGC